MKETGGSPSETPKDITKILELTVSKLFEVIETSEGGSSFDTKSGLSHLQCDSPLYVCLLLKATGSLFAF